MHLIIGGRYMGKSEYAGQLYGSFDIICDMEKQDPKDIDCITGKGLITDIHTGVKKLMKQNIIPCDFFMSRIDILRHCIITGDEIGGGVVPIDEFSRRWRDNTGLLYQALAREADIVDRIFMGLAMRLKG